MKLARITILILIMVLLGYQAAQTRSNLPVCNLQTIGQVLPLRIFAEQTIDGSYQPVLLTRFFHNKVGIFLNEFARCYFNVFDLNFVAGSIGFLGLLLILVALYQLIITKKFIFLGVFLITPLFSILALPGFLKITNFIFWTFAVWGAIILLKINKLPRAKSPRFYLSSLQEQQKTSKFNLLTTRKYVIALCIHSHAESVGFSASDYKVSEKN